MGKILTAICSTGVANIVDGLIPLNFGN